MAKNDEVKVVDLDPAHIGQFGVCGYKDAQKHLELKRKISWLEKYYPKGLRIKAVVTGKGGYQGMIEYIPGELAHRPVEAKGTIFIHCLFVGFKKEYKGKGLGSLLLDECIKDAKLQKKDGVAVVTREGSFMAKKGIFLKRGFKVVDHAEPDFDLLVLKFKEKSANPRFQLGIRPEFAKGLVIMRSPQCPYSVKNVDAIMETAKKMGLKPRLVELDDAVSAQKSASAFGTFCILLDGKVLSYHPISNTRFENIMRSQ